MKARALVRAAPLALLLGAVACGAEAGGAESAHVVVLRFADGTFGVTRGEDDDATRGVSRLCATERFERWGGASDCGGREACREAVRGRVAAYFSRYDVRFVLEPPPEGAPYSEVIVAPPNADCTFGQRGVSYADCGDANARSLAFAFDCDGTTDACAVLVAHETAHMFGLVHVLDETDIMVSAPEDPALAFRATSAPTNPNGCGIARQSSHEALLAALGPAR